MQPQYLTEYRKMSLSICSVNFTLPSLNRTSLTVYQFGGMQPLWIAQKHCIRVLFGDREKFLSKFKACARTTLPLIPLSCFLETRETIKFFDRPRDETQSFQ